MAGNFLLAVPSNLESPLMYEVSEHQGNSGASSTESSASSLGNSVTACKKVLCSDSPLESTDYWLQNQRTLCRIDFVEDKSDSNCASMCFVNLAVDKEDYNQDKLKQKLISVSPDLPKLISCLNVQQPKENEIVLLSGLSSGNLQAGFEVPQCPWEADVCLVQCARNKRANSTKCIIYEINKFLIGLEFVQERQLHLDAKALKPEDDTNCSVSSIEEDFLTASEHLEDENEDDLQDDHPEPASDIKKTKPKASENFKFKKGRLPFSSEESYLSKMNVASCETSHSSDDTLMETTIKVGLSSEGKTKEQCHQKRDMCGREPLPIPAEVVDKSKVAIEKPSIVKDLGYSPSIILDEDAHGVIHDEDPSVSSLSETSEGKVNIGVGDESATAGQYATNLAESVLQDAFIRLSQSEPGFREEAAVCISAGDSLLSAGHLKEGIATSSRPWQELPKIVIVQSPDSYENTSEWLGPHVPQWKDPESLSDTSGVVPGDATSSGDAQNALEVALACAAAVIGTITSPHAAEQIKLEHENVDLSSTVKGEHELQAEISQASEDSTEEDYSLPSAICGMTQVASAVAVCGLDDKKDQKYPATASGLLAAADATAAITLHCSIAVGSSLQSVNGTIAKVLLKEGTAILNTPTVYTNVGEFIESINGRIIESVTSPHVSHLDDASKDEVAQSLSNVIIKHSLEEFNKKQRVLGPSECNQSEPNRKGILMEIANELLFNVVYSTCKKMTDVVLSDELCPGVFEDKNKWQSTDETENHCTELRKRDASQKQSIVSQSTLDLRQVKCENSFYQCEGKMVVAGSIGSQAIHSSDDILGQNSLSTKTSPKRGCTMAEGAIVQTKRSKERRSFFARGSAFTGEECQYGTQEHMYFDTAKNVEPQEKQKCESFMNSDVQVSVSLLSNHVLNKYPSQPVLQVTHSTDYYCVADFAEELAETVVSMATEIAAICLENSNGKQPWFCSWARGNDYLMPQSISCRTIKRKKEPPANGSVTRKHRPPRLSEIKRKTDEHPELKERLMNRVVDDSINLEDGIDSVNIFANEVANRIMNLTDLTTTDLSWQSQNHARNRLHCERWNRGKASSYESIPEEDCDSKCYINTLGPMSILGQPFSRTSSISKQSSCESITDEFSRFMVNQMEDEGREFDLLLDYYAGKNANNILHSALQQVTRKNGHLNVRPSCPSKQSSTESITEEFYRYMLQEIDKDNKDSLSSRNTRDWSSNLLPPSPRTPLSFRQSSMPDSRSSNSRLTVNAPVKANSLDGYSKNTSRDFLSVQPVGAGPSSALCKSDSCIYQRCRNDQITDMLIHETWKSSIEALMRKNKIIGGSADSSDLEDASNGSPLHVEKYANELAADIVQSGKSLIMIHQDSFDYTGKESDSRHVQGSVPQLPTERRAAGTKKGHLTKCASLTTAHPGLPSSPREVPLIQIESDQRDAPDVVTKRQASACSTKAKTKEQANKGKLQDFDCEKSTSTSPLKNHSLRTRSTRNPEAVAELRTTEELPTYLCSSDESTGSWSQLANDEDNPDDTSSYLQLSERSISALSEEKTCIKNQQENPDECTSGLSVGTASCQNDLFLVNYDVEPECANVELRTTLQWIAASELGIPTMYFKKTQEKHSEKLLDVMHLAHRKAWKVGDIFKAVIQFCQQQEQSTESSSSLFDWLLELG
ncbi:A-kinase anchor protein SPHKAP isoform X2 [Pleurodeles waltl]|uniref:A-kinase anchor protein SPHKAP isoform X2 n=1 Tax=Pleurodeles waltl TaxID=8319 RepID=UPI0037096DEF